MHGLQEGGGTDGPTTIRELHLLLLLLYSAKDRFYLEGMWKREGGEKELFLAWKPNYRGAISRNDASSYSVKKTLCKQGGGRGEGTHSCAGFFCAKMTSLLRGHLISSALCLQSLPRGIFRIRSDEET